MVRTARDALFSSVFSMFSIVLRVLWQALSEIAFAQTQTKKNKGEGGPTTHDFVVSFDMVVPCF